VVTIRSSASWRSMRPTNHRCAICASTRGWCGSAAMRWHEGGDGPIPLPTGRRGTSTSLGRPMTGPHGGSRWSGRTSATSPGPTSGYSTASRGNAGTGRRDDGMSCVGESRAADARLEQHGRCCRPRRGFRCLPLFRGDPRPGRRSASATWWTARSASQGAAAPRRSSNSRPIMAVFRDTCRACPITRSPFGSSSRQVFMATEPAASRFPRSSPAYLPSLGRHPARFLARPRHQTPGGRCLTSRWQRGPRRSTRLS